MAEIENAEALTKIFGYWPSFHDAEVLRIRLDNREGEVVDELGQRPYPTVECDIHVFEMTNEVHPQRLLQDAEAHPRHAVVRGSER